MLSFLIVYPRVSTNSLACFLRNTKATNRFKTSFIPATCCRANIFLYCHIFILSYFYIGGSPHLSCKRDQMKMRDYMDRRVNSLSGFPHLPRVPHLHVNRRLMCKPVKIFIESDRLFFFFFLMSLFLINKIVISLLPKFLYPFIIL